MVAFFMWFNFTFTALYFDCSYKQCGINELCIKYKYKKGDH
jgi:hypothetical protein